MTAAVEAVSVDDTRCSGPAPRPVLRLGSRLRPGVAPQTQIFRETPQKTTTAFDPDVGLAFFITSTGDRRRPKGARTCRVQALRRQEVWRGRRWLGLLESLVHSSGRPAACHAARRCWTKSVLLCCALQVRDLWPLGLVIGSAGIGNFAAAIALLGRGTSSERRRSAVDPGSQCRVRVPLGVSTPARGSSARGCCRVRIEPDVGGLRRRGLPRAPIPKQSTQGRDDRRVVEWAARPAGAFRIVPGGMSGDTMTAGTLTPNRVKSKPVDPTTSSGATSPVGGRHVVVGAAGQCSS